MSVSKMNNNELINHIQEKNKLSLYILSRDNKQKQSQIDDLKNKFLDLDEAYDKLLLEASNLQQEKEDLKLFNTSAKYIIEQLKKDLKNQEELYNQMSDFNLAHLQKADELDEENEKLKEDIENLKQDIENSEDNVVNLTEERDELHETIEKYKDRYGWLC